MFSFSGERISKIILRFCEVTCQIVLHPLRRTWHRIIGVVGSCTVLIRRIHSVNVMKCTQLLRCLQCGDIICGRLEGGRIFANLEMHEVHVSGDHADEGVSGLPAIGSVVTAV